ncbi:MAG TPA: type II secretion system F family protein [Xanthobacteraceae bacterium]|nr:type II secretion system F family protein [Xanthobacteraceae bacterium]
MPMQMIALFFLVAASIGGVAWVFIYPFLSGERKAERRMESVARTGAPVRVATQRGGQKSRREQIEGSLKEIEQRRTKSKTPALSVRIAQAGLNWSKKRFIITSAILGLVGFVVALGLHAGLPGAVALAFAASFGLPRWALKFLKKRREAKFLAGFPDAVDVIVRGIKAGLPLLDSIRVITNESGEPIRSEFRAILETQSFGVPLGDACAKLYERIPVAEANFFGIVIGIQQKAGGNLSEALGNLSRVLRDRKKMQAKIQAMSMEAKASATIIGCLPPGVMFMVYITSPQYIELLWTEPLGRMMMAGCITWMFIGVMVMRKMINFDF